MHGNGPEGPADEDLGRQPRWSTAWWVFLGALAASTMLGAMGQLAAWYTGHGSWAFPIRLVASSGFVALGLACGGATFRYGRLVLAALAFCWLGDILLGWPGRDLFIGGLLAFLVGHLFFTAAFWSRGFSMVWALWSAGVTSIVGCGLVMWLHPRVPWDDRAYVIAYIIAISVMVVFAASARGAGGGLLILLGAVAFYFSDFCVAWLRFVGSNRWVALVGLPLYYGAVLMLAFSVWSERPDEARIAKQRLRASRVPCPRRRATQA
jgi:uncharacterized membrane protein YhhN